MLQSRNVVAMGEEGKPPEYFYWQLPMDLLDSFEDVFILTYLFSGQSLKWYLDMCGTEYTYIGISRDEDGGYRLDDNGDYVPEYVSHLSDMIHIFDEKNLNHIGDRACSLSMTWFKRNGESIKKLKNNLFNYFHNICKSKSSNNMWGTFKHGQHKIKGAGYSNGYVVFNQKAENKWRDKTVLAYCANIFLNVGEKIYLQQHGVEADEDTYALSTMVQWIWRSAIRDGKEIQIYVPSKRMRTLLIDWIASEERRANHEENVQDVSVA